MKPKRINIGSLRNCQFFQKLFGGIFHSLCYTQNALRLRKYGYYEPKGAQIPEEVERILHELVIHSMSLQFVCRLEAKKVLELVTFTSGARLSMFELSKSIASESLIPQRLFDDGDELVFVADMLSDEFSRLLNSAVRYVFITCERLRPEFTTLLKDYIE
ncbi:unnamed protein product, partial [Cylicostephanus goldi]